MRHHRLLRRGEAGELRRQLELARADPPRRLLHLGRRLHPRRAAERDPRLAGGGLEAGEPRGVGDRAAEGAERVEPRAEALDAGGRRPAVAGLEADDAAERGGPDHRAGGLRAVGDRHHPGRDRGGRAARRAAGRAIGIVRVDGHRRLVGRELGADGLAEDHRALLAQPGDAVRVALGPVPFVDRRAVGGRHVRRVDHVLDADRQPVQRPARRLRVTRARLRERGVGVEVRPRAQLALARLDPRRHSRTRSSALPMGGRVRRGMIR